MWTGKQKSSSNASSNGKPKKKKKKKQQKQQQQKNRPSSCEFLQGNHTPPNSDNSPSVSQSREQKRAGSGRVIYYLQKQESRRNRHGRGIYYSNYCIFLGCPPTDGSMGGLGDQPGVTIPGTTFSHPGQGSMKTTSMPMH